jgi:hypothetical protein
VWSESSKLSRADDVVAWTLPCLRMAFWSLDPHFHISARALVSLTMRLPSIGIRRAFGFMQPRYNSRICELSR